MQLPFNMSHMILQTNRVEPLLTPNDFKRTYTPYIQAFLKDLHGLCFPCQPGFHHLSSSMSSPGSTRRREADHFQGMGLWLLNQHNLIKEQMLLLQRVFSFFFFNLKRQARAHSSLEDFPSWMLVSFSKSLGKCCHMFLWEDWLPRKERIELL